MIEQLVVLTPGDIIALSKGMAAGYFPLGTVMTRDFIVEEVVGRSGFAHGFTYAGNPMAGAMGLEVLNIINIIVENDLPGNAARVGARLKKGLETLAERHAGIGQVRGQGLLTAIELVQDRRTRLPFAAELQMAQQLADSAFEEGLIIYPRRPIHGLSGDHVLVAPPLTVTAELIDEILNRMERTLVKIPQTLKE